MKIVEEEGDISRLARRNVGGRYGSEGFPGAGATAGVAGLPSDRNAENAVIRRGIPLSRTSKSDACRPATERPFEWCFRV
jgi:hypothetical protein